jgi:DNA processing protein
LLQHFGSAERIFRASPSELAAAGLASSVAQSIASGCAFDPASEQVDKLKAAGATLLPLVDASGNPPGSVFIPGQDHSTYVR